VVLLAGGRQHAREAQAARRTGDHEGRLALADEAAARRHLDAEDKQRLKGMVRSASSVSPYLFIWALPGSMLLLPFLAWFLDSRRKNKP
jgi:hypothetical protein